MESTNTASDNLIAYIRHGERADKHQEEGIAVDVYSDPPLTTKGKEMAHQTGKYLKTWLTDLGYDDIHICSSPFMRTMQTAAQVALAFGKQEIQLNYHLSEALYSFLHKNGDPFPQLLVNTMPVETVQS